eukprot:6696246-Heterocapsa_arctica.AAC.1
MAHTKAQLRHIQAGKMPKGPRGQATEVGEPERLGPYLREGVVGVSARSNPRGGHCRPSVRDHGQEG